MTFWKEQDFVTLFPVDVLYPGLVELRFLIIKVNPESKIALAIPSGPAADVAQLSLIVSERTGESSYDRYWDHPFGKGPPVVVECGVTQNAAAT